MRIHTLIVDRDSQSRAIMGESAHQRDHKVFIFETYEAALAAAEVGPFDILLVDLGGADLEGLKFCRSYRSLPLGKFGLIVALTSTTDPDILRQALEAGANDLLKKPLVPGILHARLLISEFRAQERTERVRTVAALRHSESQYRDLYQNATDILFSHDLDGRLLNFNDAMVRTTGYSREALQKMRFSDLLTTESQQKAEQNLQQLFSLNFPTIFEISVLKRGGGTVTLELNTLLNFEDGYPVSLRGAGRDISDRREAERSLRASEESFRTVFNSVHDAILLMDEDARIVDVNDKMLAMYAVDRDVALKLSFARDLSGPASTVRELTRYWEQVQTGVPLLFHWQARRPMENTLFDAEIVLSRIELNRRKTILATVRDITRRKQAERALHEALDKLNLHVENSPLAVIEWDAQCRVIRWSRQAERLFGWRAAQLIGRRWNDWPFVHPEDQRAFGELLERMITGTDERSVATLRNHDLERSIVWCEWYNSVVFDDQENLLSILSLVQNVTARYLSMAELEEKQSELERANEQLAKLAAMDGLTGLANRRLFDIRLAEEWGNAIREGSSLTLIMFDIDFFKRFNDSRGHLAGDDCLREVARCLQSCIHRPNDLAARYGGEEFAVLLPDVNLSGGDIVARRIHRQVADLGISHPDSAVAKTVTLSGGVACMTPVQNQNSFDLIAAADRALYQAKQRGRNQIALDEPPPLSS